MHPYITHLWTSKKNNPAVEIAKKRMKQDAEIYNKQKYKRYEKTTA